MLAQAPYIHPDYMYIWQNNWEATQLFYIIQMEESGGISMFFFVRRA